LFVAEEEAGVALDEKPFAAAAAAAAAVDEGRYAYGFWP
jgi:hypothetical protein